MSFDNNLWLANKAAAEKRGEVYDWFDHQRHLGNIEQGHAGMLGAMSRDPAAEQAVRDATIRTPGIANSWGMPNQAVSNPNGHTGVHSQQTGVGFSGNNHLVFGNPTGNNSQAQLPPELLNSAAINQTYDGMATTSSEPSSNIPDDGFTFGGESTVEDNDNPVVTGADGTGPGGQQQPNVPFVPAESPLTYGGRADSTPFLDAYMRAQQRAAAPGPVTSTMKKYLEE